MFKPRRTLTRKCKENRQFPQKRQKLEGNSNVTSSRVTIPPRFLCIGSKANTSCKPSNKENFDHYKSQPSSEIFTGFLGENFRKSRRSSRLCTNKPEVTEYCSLTVSDYYSKCLKNWTGNTNTKIKPQTRSPCVSNFTARSNSNSLFREINERFARKQDKTSDANTNFDYRISAVVSPSSKVESFRPSLFCVKLNEQIVIDLNHQDYFLKAKLAVFSKIRDINERLRGKMNPDKSIPKANQRVEFTDKAVQANDFQYVPKCEWVFETPPRQKVVLPQLEKCSIQPAVIYTTKKQSNIYELNPNVKVDLINYTNRQNIPVDNRYMRHLVSFEQHNPPTASDADRLADIRSSLLGKRKIDGEYMPPSPISTVTQHFSQVTCRPTKTVKKKARIDNFYHHKDEVELEESPSGPNLFQSVEEFERDITFMEEGGEYKIVNTQSSTVENGFNFNFRKNLFHEEEKLFNFNTEEPKMFNFNHMMND